MARWLAHSYRATVGVLELAVGGLDGTTAGAFLFYTRCRGSRRAQLVSRSVMRQVYRLGAHTLVMLL